MMSEKLNQYKSSWEGFWSTLTGEPQEVLWNVSPALAAALDLNHFQDLIVANSLPLVDVGCGDGTQTHYFSGHMRRTVGVDISASAIAMARSQKNCR